MFCEECGAKLKKGDKFCEKCGAKVNNVEEETVKVTKKVSNQAPKKPMSKKSKIILGVVVVVVIAFIVFYQVLGNKYSPKQIAKDYIEAVINKDAGKLYSYIELEGDKTFTSKKAFEQVMKGSTYSTDIENYTITKVEYADSKLAATVTISYTTKDGDEETEKVKLTKTKDKKMLFFDEWKINDFSSSSMVVKDFEITVPKDAEVTFSDIKVDKKYLDKDETTDATDVYVLPQVFTAKTTLKAKLVNGIELKDDVTPSTYYNYHKISFSLSSLSDDAKKTLTSTYKTTLKDLYQAGIEGKSWDDIKANYSKDGVDTSDLEDSYTDFKDDLASAYSKLKSIDFTNIDLSNAYLDDDGNLVLRAKASYKYSIEYKSGDTIETKDGKDYNYVTLTFEMNKNGYSLVDTSNLFTYFSRY